MALWQFTNFNKYGNPRTRIIHRPDGEGFSHGPGFGPTMVSLSLIHISEPTRPY